MLVSVSDIRQLLECEQKASYAQYHRRVPASPYQAAMDAGTFWHQAWDLTLKGYPDALERVEKEFRKLAQERDADYVAKVEKEWAPLRALFPHVSLPPDLHVLDSEKQFSRALPGGATFVGTADAIVTWKDQTWHLQHKTLGASRPVPVYINYMLSDWHECMYEWVLRDLYPNYGGTLLNLARKLSLGTIQRSPGSAHYLMPVVRPYHLVDRAMLDFDYLTNRLKEIRNGETPTRNRSACAGTFGNRLCPYYEVCNRTLSISDPAFAPLQDRYEVQEMQG